MSDRERTERTKEDMRRTLQALRKTDQERRRLLAQLVLAQEEERKRLASKIRNDAIQIMAALTLRLQMLEQRVGDREVAKMVAQAEQTLQLTIRRLRHLAFQLHPLALDREGLAAALRQYLDQMKGELGLTYALDDRTQTEPAPASRSIAYRVAQEAVNLVRVRGAASRIHITLDEERGGLSGRIHDDGPIRHGERDDVALASMRERAESVGGWCRIREDDGRGTTVEFWLPGEPEAGRAPGG